MFSLLEDLEPRFSAARGRKIELAELTIISIQLSPRQALVVTNRNIYLFRQGILGLRTDVIPMEEVGLIRMVGKALLVEGKKGPWGQLQFTQKKELQAPVYRKLQNLILEKQR